MSDIKHRSIHTNGIWMHIAEKGEGPLILLIHGFPSLWSTWKYQITHLAKHGYHVVAPDMRGYGDSDCPMDPASYTVFHLVGDLIGLLDQLGEQQAYVVGHDWGAQVAWHLCLFRPDRVKALVTFGVPYRPRSKESKPIEFMTKIFGEGFYIAQFQELGKAEKSFAKYDCKTVLEKLLLINGPDLLAAPPGVDIIDFLETPASLPSWVTEEEINFCAEKFEKSGFTGALNYYRAMDRNWELLGPWHGAKIYVATKFIVGDKDVGFQAFGTKDYIEGEEFKTLVPNLEVVLMDGHHFIHQEKAEQVTNEILSFFSNIVNVLVI
ncbi:Epoxide hydrolase 2 [Quillaja saponaria]|uniref:soluble epoxide hydrolase n=1 Tax=Quillaja saponaria TaxID=32244 RepID=A0AAD7QB77_QUISA|nr:Epoxide hydrolase 2 [Quillaja saponaria]KAJ7978497.1 Epoxide hydrolase 2 [Quillaja saponaria]